MNMIYLMSHVSSLKPEKIEIFCRVNQKADCTFWFDFNWFLTEEIFIFVQAIKIMHDSAINIATLQNSTAEYAMLQGSCNLIARVLPLIFEEKEFFMRSMWHE